MLDWIAGARTMALCRYLVFLFGLVSALFHWAALAEAQSFNCSYAKKPAEVAICKDGNLGRLDELMAATYFDVINNLTSRKAAIVKVEQSDFLRQRNRCGYNFECISGVYNYRIRELCDWADMTVRPCY